MSFGLFLSDQLLAAAVPTEDSGIGTGFGNLAETTAFLYAMVSMVFLVLWMILYLGFLASAAVRFNVPMEPGALVKVGRRFFWRMIRFVLLINIYSFAIMIVLTGLMQMVVYPSLRPDEMPDYAIHLCWLITLIILIKPLLLTPAIMIVRNLMVFPASAELMRYRILDMKPLIIIFVSGATVITVISNIQSDLKPDDLLFDVLAAVNSILYSILTLVTGLISIWFINGRKFGTMEEEIPEAEVTQVNEDF